MSWDLYHPKCLRRLAQGVTTMPAFLRVSTGASLRSSRGGFLLAVLPSSCGLHVHGWAFRVAHVFRQVTLGKVLKVIVVMRSLFIDRTIVKGYNENVYTEDGKVSTLASFVFSVIFCIPEQMWSSPRWMTLNTGNHSWNDQQAQIHQCEAERFTKKISVSPLAFFIKLLLFSFKPDTLSWISNLSLWTPVASLNVSSEEMDFFLFFPFFPPLRLVQHISSLGFSILLFQEPWGKFK